MHVALCAGVLGLVGVLLWADMGGMVLGTLTVAVLVLALVLALRSLGWLLNKRFKPAKWLKVTGSTLLAVIVTLVSLCSLIYTVQDNMLFYNMDNPEARDFLKDKPGHSEVTFTAANGKTYHGMLHQITSADGTVASQMGKAPLLIYFGGNGECSSWRMRGLEENGRWQYYAGYSMLYMDYEGYGLNDGRPNDVNMYEEALAVYDYAVQLPQVDADCVVVMGYSLGTGPAVYLAAHRPVSGLILAAPYATGHDLYNNMLPVFVGPMQLLEKQKLPSESFAPDITCPTLIFASQNDEMVPYASSQHLSQLISGPVTFVTLTGYDHNSVFAAPEVWPGIQRFFEEADS